MQSKYIPKAPKVFYSETAMSVQKAPPEEMSWMEFIKKINYSSGFCKPFCLQTEEGKEDNMNQGIYKISNLVSPIIYAWLH